MPQFPLEYVAGVVSDDTVLTRGGRYIDADKVRFVRAGPGQPLKPQLIGGWERLSLTAVTGICRTAFAWTDNDGDLNIAFGTHSKLILWQGGAFYDITPYGPPARLGTDPLTTVNLSTTVTVAHTAHGLSSGSHRFYGATATGGISAANLNGVRTITVTGANAYTFVAGAAATSGATGGGSNVVIVPQTELPAGQTNGTGGRGYGTGGYGIGGYGSPSDTDYFPRTWSFGLLGQALVASPRDEAIYIWANDTAARATWLENSPLRNSAILTTPERVILALGTEEEASPHTYNPRAVRHSDNRNETVWNTATDTLAREKILEGAGRIIAGRGAGPANYVWTDNEVFQASYIGALDEIYRFDRLGEDCGLAGPNAACVRNQRAFWLTPDLQFMTCSLGGEPSTVESPMRAELTENLAASQRDKIVMSTLSKFNEVWMFYPDSRDGLENSRVMSFSVDVIAGGGWWSKAQLARTAFCDAGPADYPVGVDATGNAYWHERGDSNDGNAISHSLEAGPQFIDAGRQAIFMRSFWPDFTDQVGALSLTIYTREYPQSAPETHGPFVMSPGGEKVDLHLEGRIISWKISGSSGPASWRGGTPIVEGKATRRAK